MGDKSQDLGESYIHRLVRQVQCNMKTSAFILFELVQLKRGTLTWFHKSLAAACCRQKTPALGVFLLAEFASASVLPLLGFQINICAACFL